MESVTPNKAILNFAGLGSPSVIQRLIIYLLLPLFLFFFFCFEFSCILLYLHVACEIQGKKLLTKTMLHFKDYNDASCRAKRLQKICSHKNIHVAKIICSPLEDVPKSLGSHSLSPICGKTAIYFF